MGGIGIEMESIMEDRVIWVGEGVGSWSSWKDTTCHYNDKGEAYLDLDWR